MNAKFEKWCSDVRYDEDEKANAWDGWQAAIQSLEVTPELEVVAMKSLPQSVVEEFGYDYLKDHISNALEAVLSALKEQAK